MRLADTDKRFLLTCCQFVIGLEDEVDLRTSAEKVTSWPRTFRCAVDHGIWPAVHFSLNKAGWPNCPPRFHWHLSALQNFARTRAEQNWKRGCDLVSELNAQGIPTITLKGPAFSTAAFGDPTFRDSVDIDLLVPRSRAHDALALLSQMDFICCDGSSIHERWTKAKAIPLRHRIQENWLLDLHWAIATPEIHGTPAEDLLFNGVQPQKLWGRTTNIPGDTLALVIAALHVVAHGFRLGHLLDFQAFLSHNQPKPVDLVTLVRDLHIEPLVGAVAEVGDTIFGTDLHKRLPGSIRRLGHKRAGLLHILGTRPRHVFASPSHRGTYAGRFAMALLSSHPGSAPVALWRAAFPPTWDQIPSGRSQAFFRWLSRLFRVASRIHRPIRPIHPGLRPNAKIFTFKNFGANR